MTDDRYRLYQEPFPDGDYRYFQLAFVVDNAIDAARRWVDVQGVGPFFVLPDRNPSIVNHRGVETEVFTRLAVSQVGPLQIELVEQLSDGPSPFHDVYGADGTGVHHMCAMTHDYDRSIDHYRSHGYEVVSEQFAVGLGRVAFVDTVEHFGLMTEIVEWNDDFHTILSKTDHVCSKWDGRDPVRLMRPEGGYDLPDSD
jgi:hypothetical protein